MSPEDPDAITTGEPRPETASAARDEPFQRTFGQYELLEEIGRGGMGVVYKARQKSLGRTVAVKLILAGQSANKEFVTRFRAEASAAAVLQHPHIVAIHEVGVQDGQHYFSMDYVPGRTLTEIVREGPLPARRAAGYLKTIAEAIHYAHEQGILHRDLKPANVLIDENDQPRITDFGLAKRLTESQLSTHTSHLTLTGQVLGSPNYMAPEQARGRQHLVSRRTDVYALGAMLYHLLTGRPPFVAPTVAETLAQVQNTEPVSPTVLNPHLSRDLKTICLKCLEKDPARRYPTAQQLAEDLGRFLTNEPIQARPVSRPEKVWRWCRRRPMVAGLIAGLILALTLGFAGVLWQWRRAERHAANEAIERRRADTERRRAEEGELAARRILYASDMNLALGALEANQLGRARELLNRHRPGEASGGSAHPKDLRGWEWRYLWARCQGDELCTLAPPSNNIAALAFSPDGRLLASGDNRGILRLWSLDTRTESRRCVLPDLIHSVGFSPDGAWLATAGGHGLKLWRSADLALVHTMLPTQLMVACDFAPDGTTIAASWSDHVTVWRVADGQEVYDFSPVPSQWPKALAFSPDSQTLALGMMNGPILLWDLRTKAVRSQWPAHRYIRGGRSMVLAVAFSPDGKTLASVGWDKTVKVWGVPTGGLLADLTAHNGWVSSVAFSPDGKLLASASGDQTVRIWDTTSWRELAQWHGHVEAVEVVRWSPEGQLLASGSRDGTVKLWAWGGGRAQRESLPIPAGGDFVSLSPDGQQVFAEQANHSFILVDIRRLELPTSRPLPVGPFLCAGVEPEGTLLSFGTTSGPVALFRAEGTDLLPAGTLVGHAGKVFRDLAFSLDRTRLATVGEDRTVRVWDVARREEQARFSIPSTEPSRFSFSADGERLALACWDAAPRIWDLRTRREVAQLLGHPASVPAVWLSAKGDTAVTACRDGALRFWDVQSQQLVLLLRGDSTGLSSVAVSPDGRRVAAGTLEGTIEIWDPDSRQRVATFRGHKEHVFCVAFTPDGKTLVSASADAVFARRTPALAEIEAAKLADLFPAR